MELLVFSKFSAPITKGFYVSNFCFGLVNIFLPQALNSNLVTLVYPNPPQLKYFGVTF